MKWYIDKKFTTWNRIHFEGTETQMNNCLYIAKMGEEDCLYDERYGFTENETLIEAQEEITVEENNGCSTVELYDEEGNLIWQNGE